MKQYSLFELQKAALKYPPKWGHYMCPPPRCGKSWAAEKIKIMNPEVELVDKTPTELKGQYEPLIYRDEAFEIYDEIDDNYIEKQLEEIEKTKQELNYLRYTENKILEKLKEQIVPVFQDSNGTVTYSDFMYFIKKVCPIGIKINIIKESTLPENTIRCKNLQVTTYEVSSDIYEKLQKDIPKLKQDD